MPLQGAPGVWTPPLQGMCGAVRWSLVVVVGYKGSLPRVLTQRVTVLLLPSFS